MSENRLMEKLLWELADELRQRRPLDSLTISQEAQARGIPPSLELLRRLSALYGPRDKVLICPDFIVDFIVSYLRTAIPTIGSVLDPWAFVGSILAPVVAQFHPSMAIGLIEDSNDHGAARLIHNTPIDWRLGQPYHLSLELATSFDVVVGQLPLGRETRTERIQTDRGTVELWDDLGALLVLRSARLLKPTGVGLFIVSPGFIMPGIQGRVYNKLEEFGLYVDAILSLPSGTFSPYSSIGGLLVVLRREKPKALFVGELTSDRDAGHALLKNLVRRREGKVPQLGALVSQETFTSIDAVFATHEIQQLARKYGFPTVPLRKLLIEIQMGRYGSEFQERPNSVYLPLIGSSPAITSFDEFTLKNQNYVQLVLKPDQASAAYVAGFLNSRLGWMIRNSLLSGTVIPRITKSHIENAKICLPDPKTQTKILQLHGDISGFLERLQVLRDRLWSEPRRIQQIRKDVATLNRDDSFEAWIETLPFPLASVLRAYHVESDIPRRHKVLLDFFEALSQFSVTLLLSAFASNQDFYTEESHRWQETGSWKRADWIQAPDFGGWNVLYSRLAKATRTFLSDKNKRDLCIELFGRAAPDFIESIANKDLLAALDVAREHRNRWDAHDGLTGKKEYCASLDALKIQLSTVQRVISDQYANVFLLLPGAVRIRNGIHYYDAATNVRGTKQPFEKVAVETLMPMDDDKLYLLHDGKRQPIELQPLVTIMPVPDSGPDVCYFYGGMDGDQVRLVSFHHSNPSQQLLEPSGPHCARIVAALKRLFPGNQEASGA